VENTCLNDDAVRNGQRACSRRRHQSLLKQILWQSENVQYTAATEGVMLNLNAFWREAKLDS
jgi:hypothetical protein